MNFHFLLALHVYNHRHFARFIQDHYPLQKSAVTYTVSLIPIERAAKLPEKISFFVVVMIGWVGRATFASVCCFSLIKQVEVKKTSTKLSYKNERVSTKFTEATAPGWATFTSDVPLSMSVTAGFSTWRPNSRTRTPLSLSLLWLVKESGWSVGGNLCRSMASSSSSGLFTASSGTNTHVHSTTPHAQFQLKLSTEEYIFKKTHFSSGSTRFF